MSGIVGGGSSGWRSGFSSLAMMRSVEVTRMLTSQRVSWNTSKNSSSTSGCSSSELVSLSIWQKPKVNTIIMQHSAKVAWLSASGASSSLSMRRPARACAWYERAVSRYRQRPEDVLVEARCSAERARMPWRRAGWRRESWGMVVCHIRSEVGSPAMDL